MLASNLVSSFGQRNTSDQTIILARMLWFSWFLHLVVAMEIKSGLNNKYNFATKKYNMK